MLFDFINFDIFDTLVKRDVASPDDAFVLTQKYNTKVKWFEFGKDANGKTLPKTVIAREYSAEWKPGDEPCYPVNDEKNQHLYEQYRALTTKKRNVTFVDQMSEYKYYDMDRGSRRR